MDSFTFNVAGIPRPGGSKTPQVIYRKGGIPVTKNGRILVVARESGKHTGEWRSNVAFFARQAIQDHPPLSGPLLLSVVFTMPRPGNHYGSGKNAGKLKATAPTFHTSKPDATKLLRSTEDALKGISWGDDSQVCVQRAVKVYGEQAGAKITIKQITEAETVDSVETDAESLFAEVRVDDIYRESDAHIRAFAAHSLAALGTIFGTGIIRRP